MKDCQLFLLHFAGGNSYSYQFLRPYLSAFDVVSLELPGRGSRIAEPLISSFQDAAVDIHSQILDRLQSQSFLIYGHSMGAYLAVKVAGMLESMNMFPTKVFVSGNAGPGLKKSKCRYMMSEKELINELKALGGIPDEIFENPELLSYYLPILRSDFQIVEHENMEIDSIAAPITAMMGKNEERVQSIQNWSNYTRSKFSYQIFDGGHFFIFDNAKSIGSLIAADYDYTSVFKY